MFDVPTSPTSPTLARRWRRRSRSGTTASARRRSGWRPSSTTRSGWSGADGSAWLLKISAEPAPPTRRRPRGGWVGFQTALLLHLAAVAPQLPVQRVIATLDGRPEVTLWPAGPGRGPAGADDLVAGRAAARRGTSSRAGLRRDIGGTLARLNVALRGFAHPGAGRTHRWDLQNFGALRPLLAELPAERAGRAGGVPRPVRRRGRAPPGGGADPGHPHRLPRREPAHRRRAGHRHPRLRRRADRAGGDGRRRGRLLPARRAGRRTCWRPRSTWWPGTTRSTRCRAPTWTWSAEFIVARVAARIILSQAHAARDPANRGYLLRRTPPAIAHFAALRAIGAGRDRPPPAARPASWRWLVT